MVEQLPSGSLRRHAKGPLLTIRPLAGRAGLRLEGEADMSTEDELLEALADVAVGEGRVYLDLTGLRFIDVICARALMTLQARNPGLRLVLLSPPTTLTRMISVLWPGSNIETRDSASARL